MDNGAKCEKNGSMEKCLSSACNTYYPYCNCNLPCPYYIYPPKFRGFSENLEDIEGTKIRRMYFNSFIRWCLGLALIAGVFIVFAASANTGTAFLDCLMHMSGWLAVNGLKIVVPLVALYVLNRFFYGRCVCVINDDALFCNQRKVLWSEVKSICYHMGIFRSNERGFKYIEIQGDDFELIILHAPFYLMGLAKKHNPNIRTGIDENSKKNILLKALLLAGLFLFAFFRAVL